MSAVGCTTRTTFWCSLWSLAMVGTTTLTLELLAWARLWTIVVTRILLVVLWSALTAVATILWRRGTATRIVELTTTHGGHIHIYHDLLGLPSAAAYASFAIAEPSDTTDNTRPKNIIFFIVVGIKGFYIFSF